MDELKIADDYGLWILEDSCHAPGGFYTDIKGEKQNCGNCKNSDLAIFSFHPVKHISCGEGGMVTTNKLNYYKQLLKLRSHGITKNEFELIENHGGWYYEMNDLGYNYRLNDISAAMGISQLNRAERGVKKRIDLAKSYFSELKHIKEIKFYNKIQTGHAYHLLVISAENRDELYNYLHKENIKVQVHYIPIHFHPYYKKLGFRKGDYPEVEKYYNNCLSLPIYPSLGEKEFYYIINRIKSFYNA